MPGKKVVFFVEVTCEKQHKRGIKEAIIDRLQYEKRFGEIVDYKVIEKREG